MFRRLRPDGLAATIHFEGQAISCRAGESVAAALLAAGITRFRATPVRGSDRMPHCMIGVCFDCLIEIDGQADRLACLVPVVDGMKVRAQEGTGRFHVE